MNKRVLFCNIAYMKFYDNSLLDKPRYGGSYVEINMDAYEKYNFYENEDGYYRGFVETKHIKGYEIGNKTQTFNSLHIEKIDKEFKRKDTIDNVLVIFCAKKEKNKTVIVGWYNNATVYRGREQYNNRQFNLKCKIEDAVLLDEESRQFLIPRAKKDVFSLGQSNIRYADFIKYKSDIDNILKYIENKEYKILNPIDQNLYIEDASGKKIYIKTYERNSKARVACLNHYGAKCQICGFDAKEVYGSEFEGKIEVHHIKPINERDGTYKIDPEKDLIPVCPNCHMILHTKINGIEPNINYIKDKINKHKHCGE